MAVTADTPNAIRVEVKDDNDQVIRIKHELQWDFIEGRILGAEVVKNNEPKYADNLCINIDDGQEKFIIQLSVEGGLYTKLLNKLSNPMIDWNKPLTISPFFFEEENKAAITIEQDGVKIPPYFTKEDPKGMPIVPVGVFNDKGEIIDKTAFKIAMLQIKSFLEKYFFTNIKINSEIHEADIEAAAMHFKDESGKSTPKTTQTEKANDQTADTGDDLPF
jgi:hypothetical protein